MAAPVFMVRMDGAGCILIYYIYYLFVETELAKSCFVTAGVASCETPSRST